MVKRTDFKIPLDILFGDFKEDLRRYTNNHFFKNI